MLRVLVLGAAAGGGFPQWNSAGPGCRRARAGDPAARPRTQCSVAVSADGGRWVLLDASPDLGAQIAATPALHPVSGAGVRSSPIAAVVLTGADVDHVAGLLTLREGHAFVLHATAAVLAALAANPIFDVLDPAAVRREPMACGRPFALRAADGSPLGLEVEPFAVPGKEALWLEGRAGPDEGHAVGLRIAPEGGRGPALCYVPGCAAVTDALRRRIAGAALLLFDGTLWRDDEMIRAGAGPKTGRRMGHLPLDGPDGTLALLADAAVGRRVLVHLNNTNPVLLDDAPERAAVAAAGWEVAIDGMEVRL